MTRQSITYLFYVSELTMLHVEDICKTDLEVSNSFKYQILYTDTLLRKIYASFKHEILLVINKILEIKEIFPEV